MIFEFVLIRNRIIIKCKTANYIYSWNGIHYVTRLLFKQLVGTHGISIERSVWHLSQVCDWLKITKHANRAQDWNVKQTWTLTPSNVISPIKNPQWDARFFQSCQSRCRLNFKRKAFQSPYGNILLTRITMCCRYGLGIYSAHPVQLWMPYAPAHVRRQSRPSSG